MKQKRRFQSLIAFMGIALMAYIQCCMVYAVTVAADVVRDGFWRKGGRYEREGLFEN